MSIKFLILSSPLGSLLALAEGVTLSVLKFVDPKKVDKEVELLEQKLKKNSVKGCSKPLDSIQKELESYFKGTLEIFKTPLLLNGSPFQIQVWEELRRIPYGQVCSYADVAKGIGNPRAARAVGTANSRNPLAIVIPCHRVINASGNLGGYASGIEKKNWLIAHELTNQKPEGDSLGKNPQLFVAAAEKEWGGL